MDKLRRDVLLNLPEILKRAEEPSTKRKLEAYLRFWGAAKSPMELPRNCLPR